MGVVFSNNGSTTLAEDITDVETDIDVSATASFPTVGGGDYFWATIIAQDGTREVVKVTALAGSTYTVERGQDDTSGAAFSTGDRFQLRFPKVVLEDFRDDIDTNTTDLAGSTNAGTVPAPSGTNMFFYQAAAPTNWTIYSTVEDCLLAVAGGSQDYNVAGGTGAEVGSWTQSTHIHTMPSHNHDYAHTHGQASHTHSMPSHIHTMPSHTHTMGTHTHTFSDTFTTSTESGATQREGNDNNDCAPENHTHTGSVSGTTSATDPGDTGSRDPGDTNATDPGDTNATDAGSTNSQNVDTTTTEDPGDTNAGGPVSTDRPLAAVGILATKD